MAITARTDVSIRAKEAKSVRKIGINTDGEEGKQKSLSRLSKGRYISTKTLKVIEILDLDVRMVLENGRPRNGLVLYQYVGSTVLRIAPKIWFVELVDNYPRFVEKKE